MKALKVSAAFIILSLIIFLSVSCTSTFSATPTAKTQLVTVQPGNISTKVTGTGNLALENKQGLSFGQTGLVTQAVTVKVSDVLVTAGQTVDAGAVLVTADPQNWQTQIIADQHALDAKKVGLVQAQTSVVDAQTGLATAQNGLAQAQNSLATAQNGLATAQTNLATAQYNLNVQKDVKAAQDAIDQANNQLQTDQVLAQRALTLGSTDSAYWAAVIKQDEDTVATKTKDYNTTLTDPANQGVSVTDITTKTAQVNQAQTAVAQAQTNITQAQTGITQAEANVAQAQAHITQAQANVVTAQNAVDDSQTTLDEDKSTPQTITAPFKGLITQVNVNVGDIVSRSTNLIEIAQPDLFEANILITENDIFSVKLGGDATVSLDALSGLTFPAQITKVSPTATISSGVVNYAVTVSLTSTQPLTSNPGLTGLPSAPFQTGTAPSTAKSFASPPAGTPPALSSAAGLNTPTNSSVSQTITLKQGLSATVEIISQQANNVLIIPSKAITSQGQNSTVQVVNGSTTETRIVKTGITDGTNTEITQGLTQGEVISYKTSSGTSSTTKSSQPQGIPGLGGGPPGGF